MPGRLIITNGDSAATRMREAMISGEILPWQDILCEGPVPQSLNLEELSAVRERFLVERGWLAGEQTGTAFRARDELIRRHGSYETVLLWFEHDLHDQLQLLQLLDFFANEKRGTGLYLIQAAKYLGRETPKALKTHLHLMEPVLEAHLALGRLAWSSFRAPTPEPWAALLRLSTHILPFLRLAVLRLLEELPDPRSGLSRTEQTILQLIGQGVRTPHDLFAAFTDAEEIVFMGDWSFYQALDQLCRGRAPLIAGFRRGLSFSPSMPPHFKDAYFECELTLTHLGYSVLTGGSDALYHRDVGRSIGGFRVTSHAPWRWDRDARRLLPPPVQT